MLEVLESRLLLSHTWFVSTTGLDNNPGTLAQPFKTIQHVAGLAEPGDTVFIRGGTYRETVTPAHSGTAAAPITYSAYNSEVVTIDGADILSGWTKYPGSAPIYYASQPVSLGDGNNQLFVNGTAMNEAQWPNTAVGALKPATATIAAVSASTLGTGNGNFSTATISVSGLPGGANAWAGATIHFGAGQSWVIQTGTVLSSGNGTLTFTYLHNDNYETPTAGNKFYLTGKFLGLDAPGEWFHDSSTGRTYLWMPNSASPTTATVETKARQFALDLDSRSYLNIRNIRILGSSIETNSASSHLIMSGLAVSYVSQLMLNPHGWMNDAATTGILIEGNNNILENSTISHSSGNGIYLGGTSNLVESCTIDYTDYSGTDAAAITMTGANNLILANTIFDTGRDGILDTDSTGAKIENNTIYSIGLQTTDLGAIYDHGTDSHGTLIAYNKISNISTGGFGGDGVYLDNGSADYVVHNNTITNVQIPIKLNPPSYSNSVYSNTINGKVVSGSSGGGSPASGIATYKGTHATLTTLGSLGGFESNGSAINSSGQVVGASLTGHSQAGFLESKGVLSTINPGGAIRSTANAISSTGLIAGTMVVANGNYAAYLDTAGSIKTFGVLAGDTNSAASAVNSAGQVAGVSYGVDSLATAFFYSGGVTRSIGTLGGSISQAFGINDSGTVVGDSTIAGNADERAFAWTNGKITNLGTLGGRSSYAMAVNTSGAIVGTSLVAGNGAFHAFLWVGGYMHDIGTLSGYKNAVATGIDAAGSIVGYAYNTDTSQSHAFIYRNGKMTDLNSLLPANTGWILTTATGINNNLQITGSADSASQRQPAYVLTLLG
ncbi:MAG TPA: right-handed parallel beta-helix repeat-containing protein [Tepidisphaeraceae bacterium]|jgi:probable HAF family extracellular repeat protein|nr:right-handed parallel beta-helix repeat-containing protein [Tepidisphaeraceae bacterium]